MTSECSVFKFLPERSVVNGPPLSTEALKNPSLTYKLFLQCTHFLGPLKLDICVFLAVSHKRMIKCD